MDVNTTASEKPIRQSQSLCAGEQEYVDQRKQVVLESLSSLGISCAPDWVPHIALLGSGGGQRAAVSMMGSLYQMEKEGLLDTLLYVGGVSGSTWTMASTYRDPEWSNNMDKAVTRLSGPGVKLDEVVAWLKERSKEETFSLTDFWSVLTSAGIMKQMCLRRLSDEASRNATNPYPIYCAIEKGCYKEENPNSLCVSGKWFEMSPHEAGFTDLGLFVETSLLGSTFQGGELQEKRQEMDMVKLQGDLGSAFADEEKVEERMPDWMNELLKPGAAAHAVDYMFARGIFAKIITLAKLFITDPALLLHLDTLLETVKAVREFTVTSTTLSTESVSVTVSVPLRESLVEAVEAWYRNLEDGPSKEQVSEIIMKAVPLIRKWEWGTTGNFLYQYEDSTVPHRLNSNETFNLVDAGLSINLPFPPFLGDKRDIDLIIATEFSAGEMFETLIQTEVHAAQVEKSFPEIDKSILKEKDWPKECYVFEGKDNELSIVYMPLFNRGNCKDAAEVKAKMTEFTTFQGPFSQEKIESLLETAKNNIKNNKKVLLKEINKAVLRRQNKKKQREGEGSV